MTVPIDVAAGVIFLVSCAVGCAVYAHTKKTSSSVPKTGCVGTSFTAGSVALLALAFLFGVNPTATEDTGSPAPSPVSTTAPAGTTPTN